MLTRALLVLLLAVGWNLRPGVADVVPGEYLVLYKNSFREANGVSARSAVKGPSLGRTAAASGQQLQALYSFGQYSGYRLVLPKAGGRSLLQALPKELLEDPNVLAVTPNHVTRLRVTGAADEPQPRWSMPAADGVHAPGHGRTARQLLARPPPPRQAAAAVRAPRNYQVIASAREALASTFARRIGSVRKVGKEWRAPLPATGSVVIVDSGVDLRHPELNVVSGFNALKPGTSADARLCDGQAFLDGHGTHCAGIVGARVNGRGMIGVAPGTRLISVQVMDECGNGDEAMWVAGLQWVLKNRRKYNVTVVSMSMGFQDRNCVDKGCNYSLLRRIMCELEAAGVLLVAAVGNSPIDMRDDIPTSFPEVLGVTAFVDTDGAPFGRGPAVSMPGETAQERDDSAFSRSSFAVRPKERSHTVAASGMKIYSTVPSFVEAARYGIKFGTSMSCPQLAGLGALCMARGPCKGKRGKEVIKILLQQIQAKLNATRVACTKSAARCNKFVDDSFRGSPSMPLAAARLAGGAPFYGPMAVYAGW